MYEDIKWKVNPGVLKNWNFDDTIEGLLSDALCDILGKRMELIFGDECGVHPKICFTFNDEDVPNLQFVIDDNSGDECLAEINFPLENILADIVKEARDWSEGSPRALELLLEKSLADLRGEIVP